jgi:hypothetical protein
MNGNGRTRLKGGGTGSYSEDEWNIANQISGHDKLEIHVKNTSY